MPYFSQDFVNNAIKREINENIIRIENNPAEIEDRQRAVNWLKNHLLELFYLSLKRDYGITREYVERFCDKKLNSEDETRVFEALKKSLKFSQRKTAVVKGFLKSKEFKCELRKWLNDEINRFVFLDFQKNHEKYERIPVTTWKRFLYNQTYTDNKTAKLIINKLHKIQNENNIDVSYDSEKNEFDKLIYKKQYLNTSQMSKIIKSSLKDKGYLITDFLIDSLVSQEAWSDFCTDEHPTSQTFLLLMCIGMMFSEEESKVFLSCCNSGFCVYRDTVLQASMLYYQKSEKMKLRDYQEFLSVIFGEFGVLDSFPALKEEF